jgi:hypothetical protein
MDNENIYRELNEDFLYILLNLILSTKIVGNNDLEKNLDNDQKFFDLLTTIIKNHYIENIEGYKCLYNLRLYDCNNHLSIDQIKDLHKEIMENN